MGSTPARIERKWALNVLMERSFGVAEMYIRRDELELDMPLFLNDTPIVSTGFIVEDLQVNDTAASFEAFQDRK